VDPEYARFAIAASQNGRIYVLQLNNSKADGGKLKPNSSDIFIIEAHKNPALTCQFLSARYVASGASDGEVCIWDLNDKNHFVSKHMFHKGGITAICANDDDSNTLLTGSIDKTVKVWDIRVKNPIQQSYKSHLGAVHDITFMPGMLTCFASGSEDGSVRLYDLRMDKEISVFIDKDNNDGINSISFSPSGRVITAATDSRLLKCWDTLFDLDPF